VLKLRHHKKYIGKVVKWDPRLRKGIAITGSGLEVEITHEDILGRFDNTDDGALFYVVFRKLPPPPTLIQGGVA
jgi:hypothetical protein